jgi:hypothetical protein
MAFTTAQVDLMERTLEKEPDIAVNRLKTIIGSTNWLAVREYIGLFKSKPPEPVSYPEPFSIGLNTENTHIQMLREMLSDAQAKEEKAIVELNACVLESAYTRELLSIKITGYPTEK